MTSKIYKEGNLILLNNKISTRGHLLEKSYFKNFIEADDLAFYVFCPYTVLLKFVEGKKAKFPKKLHWKGLHKIHFILHRFGSSAAEKVIREINGYEQNPRLAEFRELAIKMFKSHLNIQHKEPESVEEYTEVRSEEIGVHDKIPLAIDHIPIIEYFVEETFPPSYEDKLRLTIYVLLLETKYRINIDYGIVEYPLLNESQKILIDNKLRSDVLTKRAEMEKIIKDKAVNKDVPINIKKCNICYYQDQCDHWRIGTVKFFV